MPLLELRSRLENGLRDHELYGAERPDRGRKARVREVARNLAIGLGMTRLAGQQIQFTYRGFRIPADLAEMTGAGAESWEEIALAHVGYYARWTPIRPTDAVLEIGCGIGRDAFHLVELIGADGRYVGLDVTRASIEWCERNITRRHGNFEFVHLDVRSPMYNPDGAFPAESVRFPLEDARFDLVALHSVFTHMFRPAIVSYLTEIGRVLRPGGKVLVSFFVVDDETLAAAGAGTGVLTFRDECAGADRINDAAHPEAAVAYRRETVEAMVGEAGLTLIGVHGGFWSGLYPDAPNGQDIVVLERPPNP